ncbi:MAG: methyl-accepting chemotaxis protein [Candidatus Afipia apatlaquensis]|uniref:Methyl-accepting chemotaxis protein n=1 Tax=Candidatus Afipia apatlaquensis TaxID=2712852 RepID=A0A7C9RIR0_9BRAD|nr:methyl-accepting chemotaxis protein [Candidatus Afipia apatlaquensis]
MASGLGRKSLGFLKFKLGTKATICAAVLIAATTSMVVGAAYWSLSSEFEARGKSDIETSLRTLALAFAETYGDAKVTIKDGHVSRAEIPAMPAFKDHGTVDRAVSYVGGNATIFVYDDATRQFVRRTTNVKKENGDRAVGTQLAPDHPAQQIIRNGQAYKGPAVLFGKSFMTAYQPVFDAAGKVIGILYVGIPTAPLDAMLQHAMVMMTVAAVIGALLVLGLTMLIVRSVTRPLRSVTDTLTSLAEGKPDVTINHVDRYDEIGSIARTIGVFKNNSLERRRLEAERKTAEAESVQRRKAELQSFVDEFQSNVGGIIDKVLHSSGEFESAARNLTETARSTAHLSKASADASAQASEHVRNAAAASEELTSSIAEISRRVQESNGIAADAVQQAVATDARMADLSMAGDRIGDVVKLITSIAEQTNLLALNATIEAARAGEAGRGFAVVAQEVKNLAGQTAKATDEISSHIVNMQSATRESVAAIKAIGQTIEQINDIATSIAAAVEQQGAATHEIAKSVQAAATVTTEVAANVGDVARGANRTGETSDEILNSAQALSGESLHLQAEVARFLDGVRAA